MPDAPIIKGFTIVNDNKPGLKEYCHEQTGQIFVLIPAGGFTMGANDNKHNRDVKPGHLVNLKAFLLAKYPVTQGIWEKTMGNNPSCFKKGCDYPIDTVSWDNCLEFCQKTGLRLPTEAEWEYAYRAGTETQYYWGDLRSRAHMWYQENSEGTTHPVGVKLPNAYGLYDMAGNIWQWCQDWYGFYSIHEQTDPIGPEAGDLRVVRGGSWFSFSYNCRAANRFGAKPDKLSNLNGFRCACSL